MSSKDLLMRAFAGVFFQKPGQHFHIHTVVLLIFDLVKQLFEFFALQSGNRSLHIYLCLFSGAGKNHQMFHLDIINIIFRENTAYRIDPLLPRQSAGWEDMSFCRLRPLCSIFRPAAAHNRQRIPAGR